MKLSVVLSVHNEQENIEDCLKSVKDFADEIIVVNNGSTDNTVSIAKKYTAKIYNQDNDDTKIDLLKNYGFSKVTGDWILSLDADERVDEKLKEEIKMVIKDTSFNGFKIPRQNIIFKKWIRHSLWWPDYQLRLFKRNKGKYEKERVHEQLVVEGKVGMLNSPMQHENYQTVSQFLQKLDKYTENEANQALIKNVNLSWLDSVRLPVRDFLKTFFLQRGYKDGMHGLILSTLQSFYTFIVFAKIWQKQGSNLETPANFLELLYKELFVLLKEIKFWFLTEFIASSNSKLQKLYLRLVRKIISP